VPDFAEAAVDGLRGGDNLSAMDVGQGLHTQADPQYRHTLRFFKQSMADTCAEFMVRPSSQHVSADTILVPNRFVM